MILGMTGTRNPLTFEQLVWLHKQVDASDELHHGACINADEDSHDAAIDTGTAIVVHPPTDERLMMPKWKWSEEGWAGRCRAPIHVMTAKPYLERNRDIVTAVDRMIALPDGPERPNGGTWYTVRYALNKAKKIVTICYPDGTVKERLPPLE